MAATATASAGPRYAPEDPTLPKPWKGLVDGKTGYLYFWNPETNVTQYDRPTGSAPPPKAPSAQYISSSVQVQQSSQGQRRDEGDDRYGRGSNGSSKFDAAPRNVHVVETARSAPVSSNNGPSGPANAHGGSLIRGNGPSDTGSGLSAEAYCRRHEITAIGDNVPPPFTTFEATGFPSEILREVQNAGFSAPTPIQAQSWPVALQSRDIVAIAKTGSGKTLGYLLPGFMHLKRTRNNSQMGPTVLVLSPTRELATQIQDEAMKFGKSSRIAVVCLYGGAPKGPQLRDIDRGADVVVATPGRLNDILEMKRISLHQVSYLVLDEADRMLDMGFEPQIRKIVKEIPARRQTLMYTATWPKEVRKIASDLLVNSVQVNIGNVDELVANKSITQHVEVMSSMEKHRRLEQILRSQEPGSKIIIFCSTKKMCDQLSRNLTRQFGAAAIHGDKSQAERDHVLSQFRTGRTPILVATDVAARGLDVKDIRVVINYDFPTGVEDYVHRIGRTGRAGATGLAYTFFGDQDAKYAAELIKVLEGANQRVPPEIRDLASRGGGMNRFRRWGSGSALQDQPHRSQSFHSALKSVLTPKNFYVVLGPLLCAIICVFVKIEGPVSSRNMLAVLAWVFGWWLTEAVPMPITSMAPLFLFPLFGIASADDVAHSYMDDVIALVLGSFILALAVEHYNIHRRLALNITILFCGDPLNPPLLLLGICATTAFVSMWMHNVSAAVMMMPVATGILHRFPVGPDQTVVSSKFCRAVVLGVTYSAAVGGMSTLTGTGVNLILVGMWKSYFPEAEPISFSTWFLFGFPMALLIFLALWIILCCLYCSKSSGPALSAYLDKAHLKRELELLGPMVFAEKMILAVFSMLIVLWMTRSITDDIPGWGALFNGRAGDGTASVMMATLLFIIPNKKQEGEKLMDWNKCKKLPWNIVLLLGAGFAIADGVRTSGLADILSEALDFLEQVPYLAIAPAVCLISGTITEFTSNNATTTLVIPLLIQIAKSMNVHPLLLMIPGAIGAQFAFLLPTGTPSNIVGFTTGHIEIKDMIKVGLPLKIAGIAVLTLLMPTLGTYVFGTNEPVQ